MAMLVALTLAFPSCNVEMELGNNTLEYRERTAYLCSYDWQDDWYDDYGLHHFQVLRFYTNGTGEDFIRIQDARGRWEGIYLHLYVGLVRRFLHQHPVELRRRRLLLHGQYPPGRRTNGMPARRCGCMLLQLLKNQ